MSKANSNTSTTQQVFRGEVIDTFPRRTIEPMMSSRTGSMMVKNAMLQIGSDKCLALTNYTVSNAELRHAGSYGRSSGQCFTKGQ